MPDMRIDRLTLRLSGFSAEHGRRLARLIAEGLAGASLPGGIDRPAAHLEVSARRGGSLREISELAVAELVRQLGRAVCRTRIEEHRCRENI